MIKLLQYIIVFCCIVFLSNPTKHISVVQEKLRPPVIHVFLDEGSFAALQQMVFLLQLPAKDIKVVRWERLRKYEGRLSFYQSNVISPETYTEMNNLMVELSKLYPDSPFEFHYNYKHAGLNALRAIAYAPAKRIQMLHMYEDSASHMVRFQYSLDRKKDIPETVKTIKDLLKKKEYQYFLNYLNTLPELFPVTFHTTYLDILQQKREHALLFEIPNIRWQNVDLHALSDTLDEDTKRKLYDVLRFNIDDVWKKLNGQPMGILFLSSQETEEEDSRRKELYAAIQKNIKEHGTVWFIKNHPVNGDYHPIKEAHLIPSHIPFEVLTIAGFPIRFAAGDGTSAFFTANAEIIAYIPHRQGFYTESLIDFKLLKPENIIEYEGHMKP